MHPGGKIKMRFIVAAVLGLALTAQARASCECRCVEGRTQALCTSSIDLPPMCPPMVCPIAPLSIAPLPRLRLPPLGTTQCTQRQILNPDTGEYEWHRVCH
jgi:hypothetical protein